MDYEQYIKDATILVLSTGNRVFQIYHLADNEQDHCKELLKALNPEENAKILDVGCGIGEVARHMQNMRPDLQFALLNSNEFQLSLCPESMLKCHGDMHDIPCPNGVFDCVMVNYALGYADLDKVIPEFWRVLKPNGVLFVYDLEGDNKMFPKIMEYSVRTSSDLTISIERNGFALQKEYAPEHIYTEHFDKILALETEECADLCRQSLIGVNPYVGVFKKGERGERKN
jgi:ubiquinone/menaquinone biosynthesis C-methylase UbiE